MKELKSFQVWIRGHLFTVYGYHWSYDFATGEVEHFEWHYAQPHDGELVAFDAADLEEQETAVICEAYFDSRPFDTHENTVYSYTLAEEFQ